MTDFKAEVNDPFEVWLEEKVARPSLEFVPRSITPNTISLANTAVCWMVFGLAALSPHLAPIPRMVALMGTGALMFLSMVLDCWDGMQARRTGKTSKIGELLDHWLDAIHVPLVAAAMAMLLELPAWLAVVSMVSNAMIYNAQLVKYHLSGRFIHSPTSGVRAQFGLALSFALTGVLFLVVPRETVWLGYAIIVVALVAVFEQLKQCWFYYDHLTGQLAGHYPLIVYGLAFGGLYMVGAMDALAFVLLIVFLSFRLSGTYVLFTIVKKPFNGNDLGIAVFVALIAAAHFLGIEHPASLGLAYAACAYLCLRNALDFTRHLPALRPATQVAAS